MRPRTIFLMLVTLAVLPVLFAQSTVWADEWPQWRGPNRDGVWNEQGIIKQFESAEIARKWTVPVSSGYSGPTIADGRVYLTDRITDPEQKERVHCFDWKTGETVWRYEYARRYVDVGYTAGPRACVTVASGKAYALGTMGDLHCFDAATGKLLWHRDLLVDYRIRMPIWGITSAPLVVDDLVIVQIGGAAACLVGLDAASGTERWTALSDPASYAAPILIEQAGQQVMICWTGAHVACLNPLTGNVYWKHPFEPTRMVIATATPVVANNQLFVSCFYDGSLMLKLDDNKLAASQVWRKLGPSETRTQSLHSMISTPILKGDAVYGFDSYGEFRCLDAATGERIWESLAVVPKARWSTVHTVKNGDDYWMFNERGELIRSRFSRDGYEEFTRAKLIDPTQDQLRQRGGVCWAHPGYAYKHVFARSDTELVCASLAQDD